MSEVKTIECQSYFVGGTGEALYKFSWPELDTGLDIKLHLNNGALSEIGVCKMAFYENCKEGDLIVAVDTDETFGMSLENGDLIIACPEVYDFMIDIDGNLLAIEEGS